MHVVPRRFSRGVGDFGQEEEPETFPTEGGTDQGDSSYNYLLGHWFLSVRLGKGGKYGEVNPQYE